MLVVMYNMPPLWFSGEMATYFLHCSCKEQEVNPDTTMFFPGDVVVYILHC